MEYSVAIVGRSLANAVAITSPDTDRSKTCSRTPEIFSEAELDELEKQLKAGKLEGLTAANLEIKPVGKSDSGESGADSGDSGDGSKKAAAKKPAAKRKAPRRASRKKATKKTASK